MSGCCQIEYSWTSIFPDSPFDTLCEFFQGSQTVLIEVDVNHLFHVHQAVKTMSCSRPCLLCLLVFSFPLSARRLPAFIYTMHGSIPERLRSRRLSTTNSTLWRTQPLYSPAMDLLQRIKVDAGCYFWPRVHSVPRWLTAASLEWKGGSVFVFSSMGITIAQCDIPIFQRAAPSRIDSVHHQFLVQRIQLSSPNHLWLTGSV
jgi:hypothetical protein